LCRIPRLHHPRDPTGLTHNTRWSKDDGKPLRACWPGLHNIERPTGSISTPAVRGLVRLLHSHPDRRPHGQALTVPERMRPHTGVPPPVDSVATHEQRSQTSLTFRKALLRLGLVLLTAVYFLAASDVSSTTDHAEFQSGQQSAEGSYITGPVGLFGNHTLPSENLVNTPNVLPAPNFKLASSEFVAPLRAKAHAAGVAFSEYIGAAHGFHIALRRCDIIFPFHTFW
jgi:hypothetical protein